MMGALHLDRISWTEAKKEIADGRDIVVVPLGSTEAHGPHLPLGTDAIIADAVGLGLAEKLDAFLAPTLRYGHTPNLMAFAGTISIGAETYKGMVRDIVASLAAHGFKRIVLLPTHGGNFTLLNEMSEELAAMSGVKVISVSDIFGLVDSAHTESAKNGFSPEQAGVHAGEWETGLILGIKPELVEMERAALGFMGSLEEVIAHGDKGLELLSANAIFGDARLASIEAGQDYVQAWIDWAYSVVQAA